MFNTYCLYFILGISVYVSFYLFIFVDVLIVGLYRLCVSVVLMCFIIVCVIMFVVV